MAKRAERNELTGITDGKLNQKLRSSLRQIWSRTRKHAFVKSVRVHYNGRFHVKCVTCGVMMAIADKKRPINKDGSLSKRKVQALYDCDHIEGIYPLSNPIFDLGKYWQSMMMGKLQILCKSCHQEKTYGEKTEVKS